MKTQIPKPKSGSEPIQGKACRQPSVSQVLQAYKSMENVQRKSIAQREAFDDEELIQNKSVNNSFSIFNSPFSINKNVQCKAVAQRDAFDEKELIQNKSANNSFSIFNSPFSINKNVQRKSIAQREAFDDEELIQNKLANNSFSINKNVQRKAVAQRDAFDDEELIQNKSVNNSFSTFNSPFSILQRKPNNTGLPDNLKSGIENLSGYSMDDVNVHYNSPKPAQLQAHAYTQGTDIHVAPGQEQHLGHEAWHVVQQKQGRVQPTMQLQGVHINDNAGLEKEADMMGYVAKRNISNKKIPLISRLMLNNTKQMHTEFSYQTQNLTYIHNGIPINERVGHIAEAWIDPLDPKVGTGTPPRQGVYNAFDLIQGHLINNHIGGVGEFFNLFPITASHNAQHKNNVELPIKETVLNLHALRTNPATQHVWGNRHLYYRVQVNNPNINNYQPAHAPLTSFDCWHCYTNANHVILPSLNSGHVMAVADISQHLDTLDTGLTNIGMGTVPRALRILNINVLNQVVDGAGNVLGIFNPALNIITHH